MGFPDLEDDEFRRTMHAKVKRRMEKIDNLDPATRALIHEYGYNVVLNFRQHGITRPKIIRHLVELVLNEMVPTRGKYNRASADKGAV